MNHKNYLKAGAWALAMSLFALFPHANTQAAVANWQKSATLQPRWNTDFGSDSFKQSVQNLHNTGANFVTLIYPIYQSNVGSTDIQTGGDTPTDASLIAGIQYIHTQGMKVAIKMQLHPYDGQWSAYINPGDRSTWFANYGNFVLHAANLAQAQGVEEFIVGTELISMSTTDNSTNTGNWNSLIGQVRSAFSGQLSYSANWGAPGNWTDEKNRIAFWGSLDYVGIAAYYNLTNDLQGSWDNYNKTDIAPLQQRTGKPILFTEIGYKAITGSHTEPWNWWMSGNTDQTEQANDYQALFSYWNNFSYMQGVHLWYWDTDPNAGGPNDNNYTPQNKSAQGVMTQWFGNPTPPGTTTPPSTANFTDHVSTDKTTYAGGSAGTVTASVTSTSNISVNLDLELTDSNGNKINQQAGPITLTANQANTTTWNLAMPATAGNYTVKLGVFSADWGTLYFWDNQGATVTVGSAPSGGAPTASLTANGAHNLTVNVGDSINFAWSSTNADSASSTYTVDSQDGCGQTGTGPFAWTNGQTLSGSQSATIGSCQAGHTYTITYKAKNSSTGQTAQDTDVITVSNGGITTGAATYSDKVTLNSASYNPGAPVNATATMTANQNVSNVLLDLELYAGNNRISQQTTPLNLTANQPVNTNWNFTAPTGPGNYTIKVGIFSPDWAKNYFWDDNAGTLTVGSTPPTTNGSQINIWWPTDGSHVSGLVPFKANINGIDVSQYTMFWQVDGGVFNQMSDSTTDYPHKESLVDVSSWTWNGGGPYKVNFIAKDLSGNVIGQQAVNIYIP